MIITISREFGAGALAVARMVSQALEYRLVSDELPEIVAARLATSTDDVQAREDAPIPLGERVLRSLGAATPEVNLAALDANEDAEVRRAVETTIREVAERGDAVIVGRLGGIILAGRPDLVRVFLYAPRDWRIDRIARLLKLERSKAEREVARVDAARAAYAREAYRHTWRDAGAYDLCLETSRLGLETAAELVIAAVRRLAQ